MRKGTFIPEFEAVLSADPATAWAVRGFASFEAGLEDVLVRADAPLRALWLERLDRDAALRFAGLAALANLLELTMLGPAGVPGDGPIFRDRGLERRRIAERRSVRTITDTMRRVHALTHHDGWERLVAGLDPATAPGWELRRFMTGLVTIHRATHGQGDPAFEASDRLAARAHRRAPSLAAERIELLERLELPRDAEVRAIAEKAVAATMAARLGTGSPVHYVRGLLGFLNALAGQASVTAQARRS